MWATEIAVLHLLHVLRHTVHVKDRIFIIQTVMCSVCVCVRVRVHVRVRVRVCVRVRVRVCVCVCVCVCV